VLTIPKNIVETNYCLLNALEEGSEVLQNITDQFASFMPSLRIFFFWSSKEQLCHTPKPTSLMKRALPRYWTEPKGPGLHKFDSRNLPGFRTVVAALCRYCQKAPKTIKARSARANVMLSDQRWHEANELVKAFRAIVAEKQRLCHDRRGPRGNGLCRLEIHIMAFLRTSG
jgi:hypothetical protein